MIGFTSCDEFRTSVENRADALLRSRGFRRAPDIEVVSPAGATVVYMGTNLALSFSLDIRDDDVDLKVIRIKNGQLLRTEDGGYSASLFSHLVSHCGYRGSPYLNTPGPGNPDRIDRAIDGIVGLLKHPSAQTVLNDENDALPR